MLGYILKRILYMIPTLFGISLIAFLIIQLPPGDYLTSMVANMENNGQTVDPNQLAALREQYGFDQPIYVQYGKWIYGIVAHGDFGQSFQWRQPVSALIWDELGNTLLVTLASLALVWALALPIGIYSAVRRYSVGDHVFTLLGFLGLAIPNFILGLVLMYVAYRFFGQSVGGLFSPQYMQAPWSWGRLGDLLQHLWIPIIVIGTSGTATGWRFAEIVPCR